MAAAPLFITSQRLRVVHFSEAFLTVSATILLQRRATTHAPYISSARDLINQSQIKYGTLDTGILVRSFRATNRSEESAMWRKMRDFEPSTLTSSNVEGIQRVRNDDYAYILPSTIGEYISQQQPCDLIIVDRFLMNRGYGLAVTKHSPLLPRFNRAIRSLKESGFIDELYRKWWYTRGECRNTKTRSKKHRSFNGSAEETRRTMWLRVMFGLCVIMGREFS